MTAAEVAAATEIDDSHTYDALVIGAGLTGLQALVMLRKLGLKGRILEAGQGVGGVWYWNRYPGARLDSESFSYQYQFDQDLLKEWSWSEYFVGQPELERYYNHVADRHNLRSDIQFDARVISMLFEESTSTWIVTTEQGEQFRARVVLPATGILSIPNYPKIPGRDTFAGEAYHTGTWPAEGVNFAGKRVAIIGTGASGCQVIPFAAAEADSLTVFQRTPNWAIPLRNRPISPEEMEQIRANYPAMFELTASTWSGFVHSWDPVASTSVTPEDRRAHYEERWQMPGFAKWFGMYHDFMLNPEANKEYCSFIAEKIRERVKDPATAEKLIPKDHLFGTKRVPAETNYYEAYNRETVELVDINANPILEITPAGIRTAEGDVDVDVIIFATGFDAFTGALMKIDIRGEGGLSIQDKWAEGPKTFLGIQIAGFPNLFMLGGPHGKGGNGNAPRAIEPVFDLYSEILPQIFNESILRWEADADAEKQWTDEVLAAGSTSIAANTKSFMYGDNVEGKPRVYLVYAGSLPDFAVRLRSLKDEGYPGFVITKAAADEIGA